jgi:hypothetical protein
MSILKKNVALSPEEYLKGEQHSEIRHEYVGGLLPIAAVYEDVWR